MFIYRKYKINTVYITYIQILLTNNKKIDEMNRTCLILLDECPIFRARKFCFVHQKFYKYESENLELKQLNFFDSVMMFFVL